MENIESTIRQGVKFLENEMYDEAFKCLFPCAEKGSSEAQSNIGLMYQLGLGVDRDVEKAMKWLTAAAEQGHGDAAHNLGTLYLTCEPDWPADPEKSEYWYNKAKELGFVVATDDWYRGSGGSGAE